jgi:hypothetical protein
MIRDTALATALFVVACAVTWRVFLGWGFGLEFAALALLVTPPLWWSLVARAPRPHPARGAAAGALVGLLVHAIAFGLLVYSKNTPAARANSGLTGAIDIAVGLFFITGGAIAVPAGALLGALTTLVQRRGPARSA